MNNNYALRKGIILSSPKFRQKKDDSNPEEPDYYPSILILNIDRYSPRRSGLL